MTRPVGFGIVTEIITKLDRREKRERPGFSPGLELLTVRDEPALFRRHLLGFAFLPHQFQLALGSFDLGMHFLLHASRRLFELR